MTNRQILETVGETAWNLARTETSLPRDTTHIYEARAMSSANRRSEEASCEET